MLPACLCPRLPALRRWYVGACSTLRNPFTSEILTVMEVCNLCASESA